MHICENISRFFLVSEFLQTAVVEKIKTHILCSNTTPTAKIVPFMK